MEFIVKLFLEDTNTCFICQLHKKELSFQLKPINQLVKGITRHIHQAGYMGI